MATTRDELQTILDRLAPLPMVARSMFGEYALYLDGRIPAFVTDGLLGIKITSFRDDRLTEDLRGPIYPGSKDYWRIPLPMLADGDWVRAVVVATNELVPPPKPRRRKGTA